MAVVESTTVMIEEREKEIQSIVQSIAEINEMYRDLATLIVDQVHTVSEGGGGEGGFGPLSWDLAKL